MLSVRISRKVEDDYVDSSDDESSTDEYSDDSSDDEFDDGGDKLVVAQRVHLEKHEKDRLKQLLPVGPHVGLFLTRFTSTNLNSYLMVCTYKTASSFSKLIFKNHEKGLPFYPYV